MALLSSNGIHFQSDDDRFRVFLISSALCVGLSTMSSLPIIGTSYLDAEEWHRSGFGYQLMFESREVAALVSCSLACGFTALLCCALGALMIYGTTTFQRPNNVSTQRGRVSVLLFCRGSL